MKDLILKHSLINAVKHGGKADVQAVLGRVIAEKPELKTKIKEIIPEIKKTVEEINSWDIKKQKERIKKLGIKIEKKEVEKGLPDLPKAKIGKVVMRLAPFPSGPLHIGNARMVILNDEYVKKYKGKLILFYDDTIGSEEKTLLPEAYDMIKESLEWLGVKFDEVFYKSDRLEIYYNFAKEMIQKGFAYVCLCPQDVLRENRRNGKECKCRKHDIRENLNLWQKMIAGDFKEGEATLRLKTDMKHPNPAFRDKVLFRITEREHPRVGNKYRVWPLLETSWAIDDHMLGITHILRGKDLVMEDMMESFIWGLMKWEFAEFIHYGMLKVKEAKLSKSKARRDIAAGILSGWDDPRTWSLQSLKKRGIQPEAIKKFIVGMGLSLADVKVPAKILYAENRKIIDPIANRYFAVLNPKEISVKGMPEIKKTEANLHPDFPKRGKRSIPVDVNKIYVEKEDYKNFKGKEIRLMNLLNIKLGKETKFTDNELKNIPKIHWVSKPYVKIKIVMPDGSTKEAFAEPDIKKVKEDEIIQLVRTGFCRCDKSNKEIILYFAHK